MQPLYEHVNDKDEVTERVQPVVDSFNHEQLHAKAQDPTSGWRLAEPEGDKPAAKGKRVAPPADTTQGALS